MANLSKLNTATYTVAWICLTESDYEVARETLTAVHNSHLVPDPRANILYSLGCIGMTDVVIVSVHKRSQDSLSGQYPLAEMTAQLRSFFPNITASLLVVTGGGFPSDKHNVHLGDVVVSTPENLRMDKSLKRRTEHVWNGIIDVTHSYRHTSGEIEEYIPRALPKPRARILSAVEDFEYFINSGPFPLCAFPDHADDHFLNTAAYHQFAPGPKDTNTCTECNTRLDIIKRKPRPNSKDVPQPLTHFATIATCTGYTPDVDFRHAMQLDTGAVAVLAGIAEVMREEGLRPVVVLGVKDYCHWQGQVTGEKVWGGYAGVAAAAVARGIVEMIPR